MVSQVTDTQTKTFPKESSITKKLAHLKVSMVRYAEVKRKPTRNGNYVLRKGKQWSADFKWVLQLESLYHGLGDTLSQNDMKQCNKLFRRNLGYVK